jgi:hypothetical protein
VYYEGVVQGCECECQPLQDGNDDDGGAYGSQDAKRPRASS